jgi:capsular exopolysaccharide synthesis family protein
MVTSAGGGEGKTSLATHLAASLARGWRNTLLIDGDLRHPAAAAQLDVQAGPGLSEVLRGEAAADEVIKPTTLPRLSVLPAGQCDPHTLQALAQEEVGTLIGRLKEEYDFVVIDVSPALPVSDAVMLGQHADAVILTVMKNFSRLPAVYAAQQRLAALDIPILGAVVIGENVNGYGINPYPLRLRG